MSNRPFLKPWQVDYNKDYQPSAGDSVVVPPFIIYRYLTANRAYEVLSNKELYFSSPTKFNDPLDMYEDLINFDMSAKRAVDYANRIAPYATNKEKKFLIRNVSKNTGLAAYQKRLFADMKMASGVCCFSECPDVTLLWSHYADSHRGVVIGFNIQPIDTGLGLFPKTDPFFFIQPVKYSGEVKSMNYYDGKEDCISHWILTKSEVWSYEKEVRAYFHERNGLVSFDKQCVKEIYYGRNIEKEEKSRFRRLLVDEYTDVKENNMRINNKTFKIESEPIEKKKSAKSKIRK